MISASKTTFSHYNLKILRSKVKKNVTNFCKNFCESPPWRRSYGVKLTYLFCFWKWIEYFTSNTVHWRTWALRVRVLKLIIVVLSLSHKQSFSYLFVWDLDRPKVYTLYFLFNKQKVWLKIVTNNYFKTS